jgi:uncharacterized protein (TIGR04552 family)
MSTPNVKVDLSHRTLLERFSLDQGGPLEAMDVQAVRLLLSGGSVVDWRRLGFATSDTAARFLSQCGYEVDRPAEMDRFFRLRDRAAAYLEGTFVTTLPPAIKAVQDAVDLCRIASGPDGPEQRGACVVLKVMHVMNHLEAHELAFHLPLSSEAVLDAAAQRFDGWLAEAQAQGLPITRYDRSLRSGEGKATKLLSKPRVTAVEIFGKLRCRLVTDDHKSLLAVLVWLNRRLVPFSQVLPGESHNTLLVAQELDDGLDSQLREPLVPWIDPNAAPASPFNPMTAPDFRMVNFVVDLPLRAADLCDETVVAQFRDLGHLIFATLEIQLFDEATFAANQEGASSHEAYKSRQRSIVGRRLWGRDAPLPRTKS